LPSGLRLPKEQEIQRIVVQAYRTLGCRGWGRADLMIRASDRKPFLLEMNTSPGMTSTRWCRSPRRVAGLSYEALCLHILSLAALDAAPLRSPETTERTLMARAAPAPNPSCERHPADEPDRGPLRRARVVALLVVG